MKKNTVRRTREKREFRFRVLDAARELFVAYGEDGVTLRKVAGKIEYSATAIYLHFPDKRSLIAELVAVDFAAHTRVFRQTERVADPSDGLKKTFAAYLDFGLLNPWHYRAMFRSSPRAEQSDLAARDTVVAATPALQNNQATQEVPPAALALYQFLHTAVFKAMAAGRLRRDLRDPHLVTQTVWCGLHGAVSLHLQRGDHPHLSWCPVQQTSGAVIECLLSGILRDGDGG